MIKSFIALILLFSILGITSVNRKPVKVMIIDTGIDAANPAFAPFLDYKDVKEKPYDYTDGHHLGHGTHIAGIIVKDICPDIQLYSCKYFTDDHRGGENMEATTACFKRAKEMSMDIVNYSGGGTSPNEQERDAVEALSKAGTYMVVASGNRERKGMFSSEYDKPISVKRIDPNKLTLFFMAINCRHEEYLAKNPITCKANRAAIKEEELNKIENNYYPAGYGFLYIIPVGSKVKDIVSVFSNVGDIEYENGEDVESTLPNGQTGKMSGSSQATAIRTNKILKGICELRGYK